MYPGRFSTPLFSRPPSAATSSSSGSREPSIAAMRPPSSSQPRPQSQQTATRAAGALPPVPPSSSSMAPAPPRPTSSAQQHQQGGFPRTARPLSGAANSFSSILHQANTSNNNNNNTNSGGGSVLFSRPSSSVSTSFIMSANGTPVPRSTSRARTCGLRCGSYEREFVPSTAANVNISGTGNSSESLLHFCPKCGASSVVTSSAFQHVAAASSSSSSASPSTSVAAQSHASSSSLFNETSTVREVTKAMKQVPSKVLIESVVSVLLQDPPSLLKAPITLLDQEYRKQLSRLAAKRFHRGGVIPGGSLARTTQFHFDDEVDQGDDDDDDDSSDVECGINNDEEENVVAVYGSSTSTSAQQNHQRRSNNNNRSHGNQSRQNQRKSNKKPHITSSSSSIQQQQQQQQSARSTGRYQQQQRHDDWSAENDGIVDSATAAAMCVPDGETRQLLLEAMPDLSGKHTEYDGDYNDDDDNNNNNAKTSRRITSQTNQTMGGGGVVSAKALRKFLRASFEQQEANNERALNAVVGDAIFGGEGAENVLQPSGAGNRTKAALLTDLEWQELHAQLVSTTKDNFKQRELIMRLQRKCNQLQQALAVAETAAMHSFKQQQHQRQQHQEFLEVERRRRRHQQGTGAAGGEDSNNDIDDEDIMLEENVATKVSESLLLLAATSGSTTAEQQNAKNANSELTVAGSAANDDDDDSDGDGADGNGDLSTKNEGGGESETLLSSWKNRSVIGRKGNKNRRSPDSDPFSDSALLLQQQQQHHHGGGVNRLHGNPEVQQRLQIENTALKNLVQQLKVRVDELESALGLGEVFCERGLQDRVSDVVRDNEYLIGVSTALARELMTTTAY